jgi:UTP--glucose-1-phosphate uridylyltransferase
VLLPDELLPNGGQTLSRMVDVAEATGESVISLVPVEGPEISNYGCAGFSERQGDVITVDRLVEKPAFEDAPSNLRITGRYVLTPDIFEKLEHTEPGRGGEIQLTDAMALQIDDRGMRGLVVDDAGFDAGRKADWLRANVELSLRGDDGADVAAMLRAALESNGF